MITKTAILLLGGNQIRDEHGSWHSDDNNKMRVLAAWYLYQKNPCPIISSAGGGDHITAPPLAYTMKTELTNLGVKAEDIILEPCSRDTRVQLVETLSILDKYKFAKLVAISNNWHLPRISSMIRKNELFKVFQKMKESGELELVAAEDVIRQNRPKAKLVIPPLNTVFREMIGKFFMSIYQYQTEMRIGGRKIGPGYPTFVVAEISGNHHGNFDEAAELVKKAKEAGADAVKFQTYKPETMTIDSDKEWFRVGGDQNPSSWQGKILYQLYQENFTPWEWLPKLQKIAAEQDLIFFSTPFDETAVDFLESLNVPVYKIASYEATDIPLLKKIGKTGKPAILSVGLATLEEIDLAVETLKSSGCPRVALLHCSSSYSDKPSSASAYLDNIGDLQGRFWISGFSDNNAGIEIPVAAVEKGASIIEKHLTLSRSLQGADARFSLEPQEFKEMVSRIKKTKRGVKTFANVRYGPLNAAEEYNKRFRRSIFATENIKAGEKFTSGNIRVIRPAFGLEPKFYEKILGRTASRAIQQGTPLDWDMVRR